jgi:hypothetical protein
MSNLITLISEGFKSSDAHTAEVQGMPRIQPSTSVFRRSSDSSRGWKYFFLRPQSIRFLEPLRDGECILLILHSPTRSGIRAFTVLLGIPSSKNISTSDYRTGGLSA